MAKRDYSIEIGKTYGKLTIKEVYRDKKTTLAKCDCECGNKFIVRLSNLKRWKNPSCGCLHNIIGKKFNQLLVLEKTEKRIDGEIIYKCQCDCDNITYTTSYSLKVGAQKIAGVQRIWQEKNSIDCWF
jgi:hypothetical protein